MEEILIEAKINRKQVSQITIMAIFFIVFIITLPLGIVFLIMASGLKKQQLIVKKESVKVFFGKIFRTEIDLPLDSINSVQCYAKVGTIILSTSSRMIRLEFVENTQEITDTINELIKNRLTNTESSTTTAVSSADELAKYKALLDQGVISQEEFDAKKKQLLGL